MESNVKLKVYQLKMVFRTVFVNMLGVKLHRLFILLTA